jgi:glycosyltransferase involved in cell wall biosynthesis
MNKEFQLKILYLYSELVGYQIPIFEIYVNTYKAQVHVVSWDKNKLKPYTPPQLDDVIYYKRSEYSKYDILSLANEIIPDIVYVSGWMDKAYLYVTKQMKKMGIPVVTAFDDIWIGSFRQKVGALIFPFIFKKYFTHAWVAGPYQFEFAKRLGFKNEKIIFDMLSANTNIFKIDINNSDPLKKSRYFLYVGNFRHIKGTDILINAYNIYLNTYKGSKWKLICVGNGEIENELKINENIEVIPFSSGEKIVEISKRADVFILPSRHEQWGVVVHEFASLGMPLLLSNIVGAKATFFINGFNGFLFKSGSAEDLANKMIDISNFDDDELHNMGTNSYMLSKRINIHTSAANFISIIKNNRIEAKDYFKNKVILKNRRVKIYKSKRI